ARKTARRHANSLRCGCGVYSRSERGCEMKKGFLELPGVRFTSWAAKWPASNRTALAEPEFSAAETAEGRAKETPGCNRLGMPTEDVLSAELDEDSLGAQKESTVAEVQQIPARTRAELSSPAPRGQRHEQMKKLVLPLLGAGLTGEAVFAQLRSMYDETITDREIDDLIKWAAAKNPSPCTYNQNHIDAGTRSFRPAPVLKRVTAEQAIANVEAWLGKFQCDPSDPLYGSPWRCDSCDLWHVSPWRPLEDWKL